MEQSVWREYLFAFIRGAPWGALIPPQLVRRASSKTARSSRFVQFAIEREEGGARARRLHFWGRQLRPSQLRVRQTAGAQIVFAYAALVGAKRKQGAAARLPVTSARPPFLGTAGGSKNRNRFGNKNQLFVCLKRSEPAAMRLRSCFFHTGPVGCEESFCALVPLSFGAASRQLRQRSQQRASEQAKYLKARAESKGTTVKRTSAPGKQHKQQRELLKDNRGEQTTPKNRKGKTEMT